MGAGGVLHCLLQTLKTQHQHTAHTAITTENNTNQNLTCFDPDLVQLGSIAFFSVISLFLLASLLSFDPLPINICNNYVGNYYGRQRDCYKHTN